MVRGGAAWRTSRRIKWNRVAVTAPIAALAAGASLVWSGSADAAPPPHNRKVTLCHARPPATAASGWVQITVSTNAVTHAGHDRHAADIIPAFDYYNHRSAAHYPGKNLATVFSGETGAQILAAGCRLTAQPTPTRTSVRPTPARRPHPHPSPSTVSSSAAPLSAPPAAAIPPRIRHPLPGTSTTSAAPPAEQVAPPAAASTTVSAARPARSSMSVSPSSPAPEGASPAAAVHAGIAAGDTGDHGGSSGGSAGWYAAVLGGAVAGLLALAGLAYWRRRGFGAGS
jgi:hypothetical protein